MASESKENTKIYEEFMNSYSLLDKEGFVSRADANERAYFSKLWNVTDNNRESTKAIPKPEIPICKNKVDTIVSNIVNVPISLRFDCAEDPKNSDFVSNFVKTLQKEMGHEANRELFARKSAILGSAVAHYVFNDKKFGTLGNYEGALEEEYINFSDVACSNPRLRDEQKMSWWIIRSRKSVRTLRKLCDDEEEKKNIQPDEKEDRDAKETDDEKLCTCFLKYYRVDGEVYHTMATKTAIVYKGRPLNPELYDVDVKRIDASRNNLDDIQNKDIEDLYYDDTIESIPDSTLTEATTVKAKFYLYPIKVITLEESSDFIYGIPITNNLINTNKCVNQLYSSAVQNANFNGNDILVVKKGALKGQVISNKAGQVIVDNSPTGDGIKRLGGINAMGNGTVALADSIINVARTFGQFNESFAGDDHNDLSGIAIAQRQAQAEKPIDTMRKRLWHCEEAIGKIIEMYIKFYYKNKKFDYELSEGELISNKNFNKDNAELIQAGQVAPKNTSRYQQGMFNGMDYINTPFYITCEAVQGTKDSDVMLMSILQSLFLNGTWSQMTLHDKRFFVEMYPLPDKDKFRQLMNDEEHSLITQYEQALQERDATIQQMANTLQRSKNALDYIGNMNKSLQSQYKQEVAAHQRDNNVLTKEIIGANPKQDESTGMATNQ